MIQVCRLFLIALVLNGCSKSDNTEPQVMAVVNGDEITAPQLHAELIKGPLNADNSEAAKKVLASLVDRQLLVQEALKLNLDRTPEVVQAIESSKAQIYAQAYMSKKLAKLPHATDEEIQDYISNHPEMFEHRKLFKTFDVIFANDASRIDIKAMEHDITTLESLETELNAKEIVYDKSNSQFLTDRLPINVLPQINRLKQGDLLFVHNDNNIAVKSIESIVEMPVSKGLAISVARKMLDQQKKQAFIKKEIDRLQKLSNIEVFNNRVDIQFH